MKITCSDEEVFFDGKNRSLLLVNNEFVFETEDNTKNLDVIVDNIKFGTTNNLKNKIACTKAALIFIWAGKL